MKIKNKISENVVKKLLFILAERVYLITSECKVSDEFKEKIWQTIKNYLFYGFNQENVDIEFKYNINLDFVLLGVIYHISYLNKLYIHFKDMCKIYNDVVLFPYPDIEK